ncbi:MAG TPA: exodeoxyribonuclease VII large subunit [Dongiaceae bacterium]|nr:exodeoxyribonuclease VII large subunit [Dongiaceae bacterium]
MTEIRAPQIPVTHNLAELTVSELSAAIKRALESGFERVRVRGEISGFKRAGSGHLYLQLKDDAACIEAVIWRSTAIRLGLNPEDGMEVVATGRITSYAERSKYQLVIDRLELAGLGALLKLLEDRKKKLAAEGLFDAARKRPLPLLPNVIGVVTSPSGAVIRDILHRLEDRFPRHVLLWPVLVQGEGAAQQVANAIRGFNALPAGGKVPRPDVLIVARGGGSLEDLMAFNEEIVVRAAAASEIPLISAVGHETDTTLIDFASDRRAPTPTAAAEMAVPVRADLIAEVAQCGHRLARAASRQIAEQRLTIEGLGRGLPDPVRLIQEKSQQLDHWIERRDNAQRGFFDRKRDQLHALGSRLRTPRDQIAAMRNALGFAVSHLSTCVSAALERSGRRLDNAGAHLRPKLLRDLVERRSDALAGCAALLESYSYEHVLKRGFALVRDEDDQPLTSAAALSSGMPVTLQFHDGRARALVDGGSAAPKRKVAKPEKQGTLL